VPSSWHTLGHVSEVHSLNLVYKLEPRDSSTPVCLIGKVQVLLKSGTGPTPGAPARTSSKLYWANADINSTSLAKCASGCLCHRKVFLELKANP
jgi:hypothetical protein